jgi:ABC-type uncharacterized transport system substrate-binding protein
MNRLFGPGLLAAGLLLAPSLPASAHPHVVVAARSEVVFSGASIVAIRHAWTFDKAYSAFITQGLDKNGDGSMAPEELQDLAKENTTSLVDFDYFTIFKANGAKQAFAEPQNPGMTFANGEATLTYLLPLRKPLSAFKTISLEVYDPTFFVAFSFAGDKDAVKLSGAPAGCAVSISRPKQAETAQAQSMSESFFEALTAASTYGAQFASRAILACP